MHFNTTIGKKNVVVTECDSDGFIIGQTSIPIDEWMKQFKEVSELFRLTTIDSLMVSYTSLLLIADSETPETETKV